MEKRYIFYVITTHLFTNIAKNLFPAPGKKRQEDLISKPTWSTLLTLQKEGGGQTDRHDGHTIKQNEIFNKTLKSHYLCNAKCSEKVKKKTWGGGNHNFWI